MTTTNTTYYDNNNHDYEGDEESVLRSCVLDSRRYSTRQSSADSSFQVASSLSIQKSGEFQIVRPWQVWFGMPDEWSLCLDAIALLGAFVLPFCCGSFA